MRLFPDRHTIVSTVDATLRVLLIVVAVVIVFNRVTGSGARHEQHLEALSPDVVMSLPDGTARLGPRTARLAIVEFTDFQCRFCGEYARDTADDVRRAYVDTGLAQYITVNLPLDRIHPLAQKAAEAAECASQHGKYWEMKARLFVNQERLEMPQLLEHAQSLGIEPGSFAACLRGAMTARVRAGVTEAQRIGVEGTPTFIIGTVERDGTVRGRTRILGATSVKLMGDALRAAEPSVWRQIVSRVWHG